MAAALITLTALSIIGITAAFVVAFDAIQIATSVHVLLGVFATMLNLLAHSLMMFYLIGKGKAVREAVTEAALAGDYVQRISRLRAPVFSRATLAMAITMTAAIMGASVDVRVMPAWPHALLAAAGIATQLHAFVTEVNALTGSARVVDEVNQRLR
jgi:precorrin-3B methylase